MNKRRRRRWLQPPYSTATSIFQLTLSSVIVHHPKLRFSSSFLFLSLHIHSLHRQIPRPRKSEADTGSVFGRHAPSKRRRLRPYRLWISSVIAVSLRLSDQKLNRKLVHISIWLAFMLCWALYSSVRRGAISGSYSRFNTIQMLLVGSGMLKDEGIVKSMSRFGDRRELLKGPIYYATTIVLAAAVYWRISHTAIADICKLSAGDGIADMVGQRFGTQKLPYNRNKSVLAGSVSMVLAGSCSICWVYVLLRIARIVTEKLGNGTRTLCCLPRCCLCRIITYQH